MKSYRYSGRSRRERGNALVISLVVVMLAGAMGAAMLQMQTGMTLRQKQSANNKRALYIAEAGLSEAFMAVAQGKSGNVGTADVPATFGDGVFWVEAHEQSDGKIALVSNGLCGSGRFSASVVIQKTTNTLASLGLFGDQQMTVGAGAVIDGYDSTAGTFESQAHQTSAGLTTASGASINANCDILVQGPTLTLGPLRVPIATGPNTYIYGDVHPGKGKSVTAQPNTTITGSTSPNAKTLTLPAISVPTPPAKGDLILANGSTEIKDCEATYGIIKVRSGAKLVIKGPDIVVASSIIVESGGKLEFKSDDGPVIVYVKDYLNLVSGSELINGSKDPKNVALLISASQTVDRTGDGVPDPPVTISSSGVFYGMLYAPSGTITIPNNLRIFGSAAALKVTYTTNSRATFDKALLSSSNTMKGMPSMISWKIVELPSVPIVQSAEDPLTRLKRNGVTPVKSAAAAVEDKINITYTDASGAVKNYTGDVASFDFTLVRSVVRKVWTSTNSGGGTSGSSN